MKYWFIGICVILLAACSESSETVAFDDLAPDDASDSPKKELTDSTDKRYERPEESVFLGLGDSLFHVQKWQSWDTLLFADRFGPEKSEKWMALNDQDSLVFLYYHFKDSLRVKNAFYNWLDCFGDPCKSFKVGDNWHFSKRNSLTLVGPKELIVIESAKAIPTEKLRKMWQKDPKKEYWLYLIEAKKGKKTVWKRIEKGEERAIVKWNEDSE